MRSHSNRTTIFCPFLWVLLVLVACSAKPVSSLTATVIDEGGKDRVIYGGPDVRYYGVIGRVSANSTITLNGKNGDTWVSFNYKGQPGWIQNFYLDISGNFMGLPENSTTSSSSNIIPTTGNSSTNSSVNWTDAGSHFGDLVTVCGPVISTSYAINSQGSPTFLNIGRDYPSSVRFVVLIWGEHRPNFSYNPESYFLGKTVCVFGVVEEYGGIYQLEITSPSNIETK